MVLVVVRGAGREHCAGVLLCAAIVLPRGRSAGDDAGLDEGLEGEVDGEAVDGDADAGAAHGARGPSLVGVEHDEARGAQAVPTGRDARQQQLSEAHGTVERGARVWRRGWAAAGRCRSARGRRLLLLSACPCQVKRRRRGGGRP
jgi:hypothetical protein